MSVDFAEPGRRGWAQKDITWGIWNIREADVHALGDLTWFAGKDSIELGCGTGYFSSWLARLGARPVGIDLTPAQLENARKYQAEFGIEFPLIEGNAEQVPFPDASFDFAISEYGASIWCDPYKWIPEAARLLKSGGRLVFLRNSTIAVCCTPDVGMATGTLIRPYFGMHRVEWNSSEPIEYHLPTGKIVELLVESGFEIEALIELQALSDMVVRYEYINAAWASQWPSEEIWRVRKK